MTVRLKYSGYLLGSEAFNIRNLRPRNKLAREVYYFFMLFVIPLWFMLTGLFLTMTVPTDIYRTLQGVKINYLRTNFKTNLMQEIIDRQRKELEELRTSQAKTKDDLIKLVGVIENINDNPAFVVVYLNSVIKDI